MCKKNFLGTMPRLPFATHGAWKIRQSERYLKKQPLIRKKAPFERCFFC